MGVGAAAGKQKQPPGNHSPRVSFLRSPGPSVTSCPCPRQALPPGCDVQAVSHQGSFWEAAGRSSEAHAGAGWTGPASGRLFSLQPRAGSVDSLRWRAQSCPEGSKRACLSFPPSGRRNTNISPEGGEPSWPGLAFASLPNLCLTGRGLLALIPWGPPRRCQSHFLCPRPEETQPSKIARVCGGRRFKQCTCWELETTL